MLLHTQKDLSLMLIINLKYEKSRNLSPKTIEGKRRVQVCRVHKLSLWKGRPTYSVTMNIYNLQDIRWKLFTLLQSLGGTGKLGGRREGPAASYVPRVWFV